LGENTEIAQTQQRNSDILHGRLLPFEKLMVAEVTKKF
jgi:hypothetical protein